MTSTLRRASWRATSSFSAAVRPAPGACSPSRSVVSKIRTLPAATRGAVRARYRRRLTAARPASRRPAWAWPASTTTGLRNAIWPRSSAPTCSIWWSRSCCAQPLELVAAGLVLGDPAVGERAVLDVGRGRARIVVADALVDDPRAADVVAVLGGVADAEAHEVEAAAVQQVDDQLQLVHRLEVRELRLVAGLDERLEGHLDERRGAAAEDRLLAEQVGLGLLGERRLEDAGAGAAERAGIGEVAGPGRAARVAMDGEQRRHAAAGLVDAAERGGRGPSARPSRRRRRRAGRSARNGC